MHTLVLDGSWGTVTLCRMTLDPGGVAARIDPLVARPLPAARLELRGAIDRLVLARQGGEVVWAEVLDYKSDRVETDELEERAEAYRAQLEAYARVVEAQTGLASGEVRLRIVFLNAGRVLTLD